jgi:hypothetical protein
MCAGFRTDFPAGGISRDQFVHFFPDLDKGDKTGNLVFR